MGDGGNKAVGGGGGEGELHKSKDACGAGMGVTRVERLPRNTQHRPLPSTLLCRCSPRASSQASSRSLKPGTRCTISPQARRRPCLP